MPQPSPYWTWCPMPGAARTSTLAVDTVEFGDGYKHRSTRGLNPVRPAWSLAFPFTSLDELDALDAFLVAHAATGFWMRPPDGSTDVFVTADEWSATIADKNNSTGIVGTLTATFARSFNPQPGVP